MKEVFIVQSGERMVVDVSEQQVTNFHGSTIYRGISNNRDLIVKFSIYPWGAKREWDGLERVHAAGTPSPTPIAFIPGERQGIAMEFIPGDLLDSNPESQLRYSLGVLIREMHDGVQMDGTEWQEHGKKDFSFFDRKIEEWQQVGIGGNAIAALKELEGQIGDSFRQIKPVFTHNDLHDGQVLINEKGLHLIDFELWREAHPMGDLASYLLNSIRNSTNQDFFKALCKGYREEGVGFTELEKATIMFYVLFASCQSLEFYRNFRPKDLAISQHQHQGAMALLEQEEVWKSL